MNENDFNYFHDENHEHPNVNDYEDNQLLSHITADTLALSCYLTDDAFTGDHYPCPFLLGHNFIFSPYIQPFFSSSF